MATVKLVSIKQNDEIKPAELSECVNNIDGSYIYDFEFQNQTFDDTCETLEFNGCVFKKCILLGSVFRRCHFVDCVFIQCDLSNVEFDNVGFSRVHFLNSKLSGVQFYKSKFKNVLIEDCYGRYANFASSEISHMQINNSNFSESAFNSMILQHLGLNGVDLTRLEVFNSPLKDIDVSDCDIGGLHASFKDLQGLTCNEFQAIMIVEIMGINVK